MNYHENRIRRNPWQDRRGEKRAVMLLLLFISLLVSLLFLLNAASASAASWSPEAVLKTFVLEHYPWPEVDISSIELSSPLPNHAPVSILAEKSPPGKSLFRLTFKDNKTIMATAQVKAFDRVFMSRSSLPKGYVLKRDDLYPALMESSRIPRSALRTDQQAVGNPLLRSIVPNAPLTSDMVSDSPMIRRGHRVVILIESPGFSIKAVGETRNDAAVGAYVKVENMMSKKVVTGLLVDENTVRVEF
jgi:flagellar basal body P-ring formation protein FlgA